MVPKFQQTNLTLTILRPNVENTLEWIGRNFYNHVVIIFKSRFILGTKGSKRTFILIVLFARHLMFLLDTKDKPLHKAMELRQV